MLEYRLRALYGLRNDEGRLYASFPSPYSLARLRAREQGKSADRARQEEGTRITDGAHEFVQREGGTWYIGIEENAHNYAIAAAHVPEWGEYYEWSDPFGDRD